MISDKFSSLLVYRFQLSGLQPKWQVTAKFALHTTAMAVLVLTHDRNSRSGRETRNRKMMDRTSRKRLPTPPTDSTPTNSNYTPSILKPTCNRIVSRLILGGTNAGLAGTGCTQFICNLGFIGGFKLSMGCQYFGGSNRDSIGSWW
jgi:hypothetical protein